MRQCEGHFRGLRAAALAVAMAIAAPVFAAPAAAQVDLSGHMAELRGTALDAVNRDRLDNGLPALSTVAELDAAAQAHAEDMLARDYFAHESPEGEKVRARYEDAGGPGWRVVGENIATCRLCTVPPDEDRVERFQTGWMNSEGHRHNILDPGYTGFGFGIAASEDGAVYAVQTFDGPGAPIGGERAEPDAPLGAQAAEQALLDRLNEARRRAGAPPLRGEPVLRAAARSLIAESPEALINPAAGQDPYAALPEGDRMDWRKLLVLAARCMGCGRRPTEPDIEYFAGQWVEDRQDAADLLAEEFTHAGFAIVANGEGMKTAVLLLGVGL